MYSCLLLIGYILEKKWNSNLNYSCFTVALLPLWSQFAAVHQYATPHHTHIDQDTHIRIYIQLANQLNGQPS